MKAWLRWAEIKDRATSSDIVEPFQGEAAGSDDDSRDREERKCVKNPSEVELVKSCFKANWCW